ncbi:helix-turn-helix domain-containing protein [Mucilaginibacter rubeus]|uniref:Helix-turn-helix transcriptional regulator n=1 Tax=Mucilaginibacter rubeus TaxID=2027860 RepID=A0A5C1I7W9_9SPHI|nr:AraC family transcriptional regulator [Mucilaginibacter rubeus]QEM14159.1 helix-turn-helix transcriptional regulator [Mucilaginibacter rubeus]
MEAITVPGAVKDKPQIKAGEISFVYYQERGSLLRNQVIFNQCAVSFVLNGQKELYRHADCTIIRPGQGLLIPEGNTLIAEHTVNGTSNDVLYSSFIVFFPQRLITEFFAKHGLSTKNTQADGSPYLLFSNTAYLNEYLRGIRTLVDGQQQLSYPVALHKLEELLLIIYELYPTQLTTLLGSEHNNTGLSLQKLVENNLFNNLTLDELAFLANRSLSSFKRDFEKAYGLSPQKYIRERKLEAACIELKSGRRASELYITFGYENLSNFNTAFKKKFGVTPAAYGQQIVV